jgi:serine/threonine protein kinase
MNEADKTGAYQPGSAETPTVTDATPALPTYIGRYRVEKVLGGGGFGLVYLAHDDQLQRRVAIKVPHAYLVARPEAAAAYLAEARTVASLDHPNVAPVHDFGSTDEFPCFVVSKYIDGTDLATRLSQSRLSLHEAIELVAAVADALHYAHKQGLVHRDVKPGNILLDRSGKPFVGDFGLALHEQDLGKGPGFAGTPTYMSPEQARGEGNRVDGRSDIFSLGVVFYELLTGRRPFRAESQQELTEQIIALEARPPRQIDDHIPRELDCICLKALAKRPSERYSAARDLADDLRHFLARLSADEKAALAGRKKHGADAGPAAGAGGALANRPAMTRAWASDANQIDIQDLKWIVFQNPVIQDFLHGRGKHFLSANKGLGKTLLLTFKRSLIADVPERTSADRGRMFVVPEGKPYLDFMSDLPPPRASHETFLSSLVNTKRLWSLALRIAALSHLPPQVSPDDAGELKRLSSRLAGWLQGGKVEPTVVFKEVVSYSLKQINRILDESESYLELKFRMIHRSMHIFIDKVDQGIRTLSRQAWIHVQAGLIEAAWDAMSANNHVKIYASIRQEAFFNYESDIKTNLFGATTLLHYSRAELRQLLDKLTSCYERGKSFKQLVGVDVVRHPHRTATEDSFEYLHRHTLGRPRDLVIITSGLSRHQEGLTESAFRKLVTEISASVLVVNVFEEMRVFLECLNDKKQRQRFFTLLPYNILTRPEVEQLYCQFNEIDPRYLPDIGSYSEGMRHPFWELYSAGLLGVLARDPDNGGHVQRFKQPHDLLDDAPSGLPYSDVYLIHPALSGVIQRTRSTASYDNFQHIVVGHDCPWQPHYGKLCDIERRLFALADQHLADDVHHTLGRILARLDAESRDVDPASIAELSRNREALLRGGQDDLCHLLDELVRTVTDRTP